MMFPFTPKEFELVDTATQEVARLIVSFEVCGFMRPGRALAKKAFYSALKKGEKRAKK